LPVNVRLTVGAKLERSHPGQDRSARPLGQTALAERLLKAIETIAALGRPDRRPSKPEKKAGRRRA